ncbi:MAG: DUF2666 family protein [Candidatus Bilamarchaeaceae archaeon]
MVGKEEILFSGKYKEFEYGVRYDLSRATERDVAFALCEIVSRVEPYAYRFSGVDCEKVEKLVEGVGEGLLAVAAYLRESDTQKQLETTVKDKLLMPAAESYFFNRALTNAGVPLLPEVQASLEGESEPIEEKIVFIGKYKEWIAIKKLVVEGVEDWEISGILSSIVETGVRKAFYFCNKTGEIDVWKNNGDANKKKIRKSFKNAADLLIKLDGMMGSDKTTNAYLVVKSLTALGYNPHASVEMLTAAHQELKVRRPRGRPSKQ